MTGFNFIASQTVPLKGNVDHSVLSKLIVTQRRVPLWNTIRGSSPCPTAVLAESGHSQPPTGPGAPKAGEHALGACATDTLTALFSTHGYHVSEGLACPPSSNPEKE